MLEEYNKAINLLKHQKEKLIENIYSHINNNKNFSEGNQQIYDIDKKLWEYYDVIEVS